ncbi:bifunctional 4-hydroxy-2-oxoglutarate aldolase/2-dehydro-3-deoxy-phosphogluconate aldolase [Breznakiellaceae bacterium SP9]
MDPVLEQLEKIGIIPVIKIDEPDKAVPLARALIAGGILCAEITFRTIAGEEALRRIKSEVPDILLGAGTVLSPAQVDRAIDAGAVFIVSPGFNPKVVKRCIERGIAVTPGCSSPTDIESALELGLSVVKFFPAEQTGALEYIKAVSAPYPSVKFIPTGGISAANISKYIAYDKVLAVGGSWMVHTDLINSGSFDKITVLCKEAVQSMLGFSVAHFGINAEHSQAAEHAARFFETIFALGAKDSEGSLFCGPAIEIMKATGPGRNGHIGIYTWSVPKALSYLERQGIAVKSDSIRLDLNGIPTFAYLEEEILGFAVYILKHR